MYSQSIKQFGIFGVELQSYYIIFTSVSTLDGDTLCNSAWMNLQSKFSTAIAFPINQFPNGLFR